MTGMAGNPGPKRNGLATRIIRILTMTMLALAISFGVALVLYRFVPAPSTLMLGRWLSFREVNRDWVPLEQISPHLVRAVIASEDQRFCSHAGVDWGELNAVLQDEDGPSRGASTLTMQTAKNLFLWPGRSYLRKALELPVALSIDLAWPKQRIIEVYLNIAEWGEGVFGAEAAAQRYFGKPAAKLTPAEAARLAGALPNPILRNPGRPNRALQAAAGRVQRRMQQLGPLGDCALPRRSAAVLPDFRRGALARARASV
ncbi:monofunctional biosynthetic peptidoglycan transglycosylase [Bosea sp. (in: a-proteobacteria)]|uniref:monofunctional biosynthetic peptidoglycan transglycosylase n=1 Tax=Bosea sp. (in: a-proteobacteria) TaxID=1871050 RepID=UPI001AC293ED|nr:monofunctional biosynthetic peptidoglycan transglycosylase [Bosea sp. (in: a-proteobacteria)]